MTVRFERAPAQDFFGEAEIPVGVPIDIPVDEALLDPYNLAAFNRRVRRDTYSALVGAKTIYLPPIRADVTNKIDESQYVQNALNSFHSWYQVVGYVDRLDAFNPPSVNTPRITSLYLANPFKLWYQELDDLMPGNFSAENFCIITHRDLKFLRLVREPEEGPPLATHAARIALEGARRL